jgi:hypothetical protein
MLSYLFRKLLPALVPALFTCTAGLAQSISGYVLDGNNDPISYAGIFIKELGTGTKTDEKGRYYLNIDAAPGPYTMVVTCIGFQAKSIQIIITDKPVSQNVWLQPSDEYLQDITVKATTKNPGYDIIQHVIDNREKFLTQLKSYRSQVYVRATETVDLKKKKSEMVVTETDDKPTKDGPVQDPMEIERKKEAARLASINLMEMQLTLNFMYPDKYKEERTAYKAYGDKQGLFIPVFSEADFNFYRNLVYFNGISEVPVISPFSRTAILSYKFKLEDVSTEDGHDVYKIRVTPRKSGDATCRGHVYINDSTWDINRLELSLDKGGLKFYDAFTIKQTYEKMEGDVCIPYRQEFNYESKVQSRTYKASTVWVYTSFEKDHEFPPKFFGNEVAVTTKEAYKRDSSYWNSTRPDPLTPDQQKMISYRDSVYAAQHSQAYLDSMEKKFNKITLGEVLYEGMGFRSEAKKRTIMLTPLLGLLDFAVIGGWRIGPDAAYYKRFENGKRLSTYGSLSMGIKNKDLQGDMDTWFRYNPMHMGHISVGAGRNFSSVNSFDAYLNQLRISNYILDDHFDFSHSRELFNGFYLITDLGYHDRQSVKNYERRTFLNEVIEETAPLLFEDYQALISNVRISYTPKQKFMREPTQKVVLGSKYPTFSFSHRKGWDGILGSDINFDYLELGIDQSLTIGTLGNSKYSVIAGKFINTNDLRYVDLKRFRQSDPILYSNPMRSFQNLDTSLSTTNFFLEAHFIHHFNGAMINNLPIIKKTRIRTVAGGGFMWVKENNFRHEELFAGVERVFKMGARRKLRIGVYGVLGQTNAEAPKTSFKVSFDIIDTWKRDWSY